LGTIGRKGLLLTVRDAGIASLVMGMVLYLALSLVTSLFAQHGFGALMTVLIELCLGFGAFFGTAYVLGAPELWQVQSFFVRQK
jgi:predicted PurR-regulated permease PerM